MAGEPHSSVTRVCYTCSARWEVSINLRSIFMPPLRLKLRHFQAAPYSLSAVGHDLRLYRHSCFSLFERPLRPPSILSRIRRVILSTFPPSHLSNPLRMQQPRPATAASPSADQSHYIISSGDVLDISVFGAPDLSQKAVVNRAVRFTCRLYLCLMSSGCMLKTHRLAVEHAYLTNGILKFTSREHRDFQLRQRDCLDGRSQ